MKSVQINSYTQKNYKENKMYMQGWEREEEIE